MNILDKHRSVPRLPVTVACFATLAVGLAACGSSGGGGGGAASGGAGASATGGFKTAATNAKTYGAAPQTIGITQAVGKTIPTGKTIVLVGAGQSAGGTFYTYSAFKQAAKVLGWNVKQISPAEPTPQNLQQALDQAIALRPDAVTISAIDSAPIASRLAKLKSMGIPVVSTFSPDTAVGSLTLSLEDATAQAKLAKATADKALADMGKPGPIGMIGLQGYQVVQNYSKGFSDEVKALCPTCSIKTTLVPLSDLGTNDGADITNFVRANPQLKSVFVGYDGMDANLFAAAKAAGVKLPKVYSIATQPVSIPNLASGKLTASAPIDYNELGWRQADALARIFTGQTASAQKVDLQYERPVLWSKDFGNVPTTPGSNTFPPVVPSYRTDYTKLWGKSA